MSSVTKYYNFRKRNVNHAEVSNYSKNIFPEDDKVNTATGRGKQFAKTTSISKSEKDIANFYESEVSKDASRTKKPTPAQKERKILSATEKKSKGKQSTLKTFFTGESDKVKNEKTKNSKAEDCFCVGQKRVSSPFESTVEPASDSLQLSPDRNLPSQSNECVPSKKKHLKESVSSENVCDQSRPKLIQSPKLEEVKEALHLFAKKNAKLKELHSNPFMINCIASSSKSLDKRKPLPSVFACERFHYLTQSDPLVLPFKYVVLSDMFCNLDSLVAALNNRKEKIIFDNVKVIMKRNFSEEHLGQIITVLPSAYNLSREKTNSTEYQLIITPNLNADRKKKSAAFHPMDPSCLISRFESFNKNLLELVKNHHLNFLTRIHIAVVDKDSIKRWHPKFPVDSVPDIPVAQLPESAELKAFTTKDVLNKFKGSMRKKVGKASQSVAEEIGNSGSSPKPVTSKELKDMCANILDRLHGKESAKLLKANTLGMEKLTMLEQVPKIVNILFLYFKIERRAAVPVDTIVDRLLQSVDSLLSPDEVALHLKLIQEKFPFWLNFVEIPKGVYITLNEIANIDEMLDNAGLHRISNFT